MTFSNRYLTWAIVLAGLIAYHNSFTGPFLFDDLRSIRDNENIRQLATAFRGTSRPLVQLSFAINHAVGGNDVVGYHAVNLAIHLLAALALYGFAGRVLDDKPTAAAIAALWVVHPINTESVTYLVQRGEALMGLFALLTLYCATRRWHFAAVLCCAAGMATKPVMVVVPVLVWVCDRVVLRQVRWKLYAGLAATWLVLPVCLAQGRGDWDASTGLQANCCRPLEYLWTQPGVILHYLRLMVWPDILCLDYSWPVGGSLLAAAVVVGLLGLTIWACRYRVGFLGAAFFLTLLPTSSVLPVLDLAVEHRMYLASAAVIAGVVLALRRLPGKYWLVAGLVVPLALRTVARNEDYRSELAMWQRTVEQRPKNARAHFNLAGALLADGQTNAAIRAYHQSVELDLPYAEPYNILGNIFSQRGDLARAAKFYEAAVVLRPDFGEAHFNWGKTLEALGQRDAAREHYRVAAQLMPGAAAVQQKWREFSRE